MILTPNTIMPMTALNFLSPDGKCFTFDARANGYGRGEGIGVVVLKRLSDAIRDNDPIRAVIRGTGVNQDGRTTGMVLRTHSKCSANKFTRNQASRCPARRHKSPTFEQSTSQPNLTSTRQLTSSATAPELRLVTGES
jgi:hypothetical protein